MDNEAKKANTISVLVWDGGAKMPRTQQVPAIGDIPAKVWEALNKTFLARLAKGWFKPLDPADAYQYVVENLLKEAAMKKSLAPKNKVAYLIGTMHILLARFGARHVAPAYRNTQSLADWHKKAAARQGLLAEDVDTATLLEKIPYAPRRSDFYIESHRTITEILPRLPEEVRNAFRAYIDTDGNFEAMAARLNVPVSTLYRRWKDYLALARQIVQKTR